VIAEWIPADPNNFSAGRGGFAISKIILHTTVGSMVGTIATFQNPTRQASAHYVVGLGGRLVQMVHETDTAWHAGDFPINEQSIGIEHVDDGDYNGPRTPELYAVSAQLVADICRRYSIACNRTFIRKHSEVSDTPTSCPDSLDVEGIVSMAAAILTVPAGPTPIMAPAVASSTQMLDLLAGHPPAYDAATIQGIADAYLSEGTQEGVSGDGAWAQACHETGYFQFGGDVKPAQWNFCGLGATGGGAPGYAFPSYRDGVRAHLRHLRAYATTDALPPDTPTVDPRAQYVSRGSAMTFKALGGHWAPSLTYGDAIEALIATLRGFVYGPSAGNLGGDDMTPEEHNLTVMTAWRQAVELGFSVEQIPATAVLSDGSPVTAHLIPPYNPVIPGPPYLSLPVLNQKLDEILTAVQADTTTLTMIEDLETKLQAAVDGYSKATSSGLTQAESQELADTLATAQMTAAQLKKDLAP
jgi:hypothetical protein